MYGLLNADSEVNRLAASTIASLKKDTNHDYDLIAINKLAVDLFTELNFKSEPLQTVLNHFITWNVHKRMRVSGKYFSNKFMFANSLSIIFTMGLQEANSGSIISKLEFTPVKHW